MSNKTNILNEVRISVSPINSYAYYGLILGDRGVRNTREVKVDGKIYKASKAGIVLLGKEDGKFKLIVKDDNLVFKACPEGDLQLPITSHMTLETSPEEPENYIKVIWAGGFKWVPIVKVCV